MALWTMAKKKRKKKTGPMSAMLSTQNAPVKDVFYKVIRNSFTAVCNHEGGLTLAVLTFKVRFTRRTGCFSGFQDL